MPLDRIDRNILRELQVNGRISNVELSKKVGLSATPCLERVRRLEKSGVIKSYTAILDPKYLDSPLMVYIEVTLNRSCSDGPCADVFEIFNEKVKQLDAILECHLVSGSFDYLLKTRVADMSEYRKVLRETMASLPSIKNSKSYVVMEEVKHLTAIKV